MLKWFAAGLEARRAADCGPRLQLGVRMAEGTIGDETLIPHALQGVR